MNKVALAIIIIINIALLVCISIFIFLIVYGIRGYNLCNNTESSACPALKCDTNETKSKEEQCGNYSYRESGGKTYCSGQN